MTTPLHPFDLTYRVTMELSNRCPLAAVHTKCPAHLEAKQEPCTLPSATILAILYTLREHNYGAGRAISWHVYNEPTSDPRLFWLTEQARVILPDVAIVIWSNAWNADETMVRELLDIGITHIAFTSYRGKAEARRLKDMQALCGPGQSITVGTGRLDERLTRALSPVPEEPRRPKSCHAPLADLTIWHTGHVGLCCYDCTRSVLFGDLHKRPFVDVMATAYPEMRRLQEELLAGNRTLPACKVCINKRRVSKLSKLTKGT